MYGIGDNSSCEPSKIRPVNCIKLDAIIVSPNSAFEVKPNWKAKGVTPVNKWSIMDEPIIVLLWRFKFSFLAKYIGVS